METNRIKIPGVPTLTKTYGIPDREIYLPFVARSAPGFDLIGLPIVLLMAFSVLSAVSAWPTGDPLSFALKIFAFALALMFSVYAIGFFFVRFWDALRNGPTLQIDSDGITDYRRSTAKVRWADIEAVTFISARGVIHAVFKLRSPIRLRWNVFRMGEPLRRGPRTELYVRISQLNPDSETIAELIKAFVKRSGGMIKPYYSGSWR